MKKTLVLFAHPFSRQSRVNRTIMENLRGLENVTLHDLYEEYPYFHIKVDREQELLLEHDMIVWQHPFYWFNMPPLMKLWCDEVLRRGFAFGPDGSRLQGKDFLLSLTTGGLGDASAPASPEDLTPSFSSYRQTVEVCGMKWSEPLVMRGTALATQEQVLEHAENVRRRLIEYCTGLSKKKGL